MDPISPISSGSPSIKRPASLPVERLERVTRERDRPSWDGQEDKRRKPEDRSSRAGELAERGEDDEGHPHVDVRA
jgi:hypothetical protein